jgi:hypothetical protein
MSDALSVAATAQLLLVTIVCELVYSARPSSVFSMPIPDCLCPPKAMCGEKLWISLIHTVPAWVRSATLCAFAISRPHTDAARPYSPAAAIQVPRTVGHEQRALLLAEKQSHGVTPLNRRQIIRRQA